MTEQKRKLRKVKPVQMDKFVPTTENLQIVLSYGCYSVPVDANWSPSYGCTLCICFPIWVPSGGK